MSESLPDSWTYTRLDQLAVVVAGNPAPQGSQHFKNGRFNFVRVHDMGVNGNNTFLTKTRDLINEATAATMRLIPANSVLFTKSGASTLLNQRAVLAKDSYVVSHIAAAIPSKCVNSKWLFHFLHLIDFATLAHATNMPSLPLSRAKAIRVPIAPTAEQARIVTKIEHLFSELEKSIESLKTAQAKLNVNRQAVLKQAFEGKLTARWREESRDKLEQPEQLLDRIKQEREERYKQQLQEWKTTVKKWEKWDGSGTRGKKITKPTSAKALSSIGQKDQEPPLDLPNEWVWVKFGQLFSISPQNGVYKPASEYGDGTQIIRIDDFYDGQLIRHSGFKKLRLNHEEIEKYKVRNSDLIINRVNSIEHLGKCALVESLTENTVFESNIMRCRVINDVISKAYVAAYLASHEGRNRLCKNAKHAVNQASINQTDVANTLVPITSMEEQLLIVQKIRLRLSQANALISQIEALLKQAGALRQSILKKAFSGQLVAQDPNDEPASVLLERIRAEREKAAKNKRSRKAKKRKTSA